VVAQATKAKEQANPAFIFIFNPNRAFVLEHVVDRAAFTASSS
jgi:hypothetical protein